jgi:hypothetical protein
MENIVPILFWKGGVNGCDGLVRNSLIQLEEHLSAQYQYSSCYYYENLCLLCTNLAKI